VAGPVKSIFSMSLVGVVLGGQVIGHQALAHGASMYEKPGAPALTSARFDPINAIIAEHRILHRTRHKIK
jgi:hypothetical protein